MNGMTRELIGIFIAFMAWWALALVIGLVMYAAFPSSVPLLAASSASLDLQAVPGDVIGFVAALYAFRGVTKNRDDYYL